MRRLLNTVLFSILFFSLGSYCLAITAEEKGTDIAIKSNNVMCKGFIGEKSLIEMVMRQTAYSYDEVIDKLKENNNDYMLVIKNAMGIVPQNVNNPTTINQGIYKEIRGLMDTVATNFRENQERERKRQEFVEELKKQKEPQQENLWSVKEEKEE